MGLRSVLACILSVAAVGVAKTSANDKTVADLGSILYTVAPAYESLAWMHGAERFPSGAQVVLRQGAEHAPLMGDFAASADPSVSFDGQRVLLAAKRKVEDPWQIWEVPLRARGEARRITSDAEDCVRPFYLPDDQVVYARKSGGRFAIEVISLAGSKPLTLTYGPANYLPTDVLRDGRILFESSYPLGTGATPELYTVYSDGSGVESYRCDHDKPRDQGRQVGSGDIVFAASDGLARFTSARAKELRIQAPSGEYAGEMAEIASGDWLLPWRANGKAFFQLMRWKFGDDAGHPIAIEPNAHLIQPALVVERAVPNRHPSGLHDWSNANLLCLNAYTSKYSFAPGSIHVVRIYIADGEGKSKLLGSAPVARDGSFFVQVPTEQPLQVELVDEAGKTLKRESGFFWMRRGEQRGCVGCHAGPETSPENAVPMILLQSTTPADMTGARAHSSSGGR